MAPNTVHGKQRTSAVSNSKDVGAYDAHIKAAAKKYNVPEKLIRAIIKKESAGNARAVSPCGAQGLMQLMPATARSVGVRDSFDPAQNIDGGTRYLAGLLRKYGGDVPKAVAAYNAGPGNVDKFLKKGVFPPPFKETRNYVQKVMSWFGGEGTVALPTMDELSAQSSKGGPPVHRSSPYGYYTAPPQERVSVSAPREAQGQALVAAILAQLREQFPFLASLPDDQLLAMLLAANPELAAALQSGKPLAEPDLLLNLPTSTGVEIPPGLSGDAVANAAVAAMRAGPMGKTLEKVDDATLKSAIIQSSPELGSLIIHGNLTSEPVSINVNLVPPPADVTPGPVAWAKPAPMQNWKLG